MHKTVTHFFWLIYARYIYTDVGVNIFYFIKFIISFFFFISIIYCILEKVQDHKHILELLQSENIDCVRSLIFFFFFISLFRNVWISNIFQIDLHRRKSRRNGYNYKSQINRIVERSLYWLNKNKQSIMISFSMIIFIYQRRYPWKRVLSWSRVKSATEKRMIIKRSGNDWGTEESISKRETKRLDHSLKV